MKLMFFPANNAYAFVFGKSPLALDGWPMFFRYRKDAVNAARSLGIAVNPASGCYVTP